MEPRDLESLVDAGLRQLPDPRAPRTLLPRVLEAVGELERAQDPWHARPWVSWPPMWRSASLVVLVAALAGSVFAIIGIDRVIARLADHAPIVGAVSAVTRLVWDALLQPAAVYALVAFLTLLFASAATWRMCSRIAVSQDSLEGAPQP